MKFNSKAIVNNVLGGVFSDTSNASSGGVFDGLIVGSAIISIAVDYTPSAATPFNSISPPSPSTTLAPSNVVHDSDGSSDLISHSKYKVGSSSNKLLFIYINR